MCNLLNHAIQPSLASLAAPPSRENAMTSFPANKKLDYIGNGA